MHISGSSSLGIPGGLQRWAARANTTWAIRIGSCALVLIMFAGCALPPAGRRPLERGRLEQRLDANFDTEVSLPAIPKPSPPHDSLNWLRTSWSLLPPQGKASLVSSTIVADPAGGSWVRVLPTAEFFKEPETRELVLIASSEPFTTGGYISGRLRLRLDQPPNLPITTVSIALLPARGNQISDEFIGGVELQPTAVRLLRGFNVARSKDIVSLPTVGDRLTDYSSGNVVNISWEIDEASRTFTASAGGPSRSMQFPSVDAKGFTITPIEKLYLYIWLQRPGFGGTALFIDNLLAEEWVGG